MIKTITTSLLLFFSLLITNSLFAQSSKTSNTQANSSSQNEELQTLVRHLPNWEAKQKKAIFIASKKDLAAALGENAVFDAIDFFGDTQAVTANYDEGKLLIVEFGTPQASVDADNRIKQVLAENDQNAPIFYRRIGNYNAFVFEGKGNSAANTLFDQIKYQKVVRWLNGDPLIRQRAERNFIKQTSSLFITTVLVIVMGFVFAVIVGIISGIIFYNIRKKKRATMEVYTDSGGLTRLNLDGLTPDISASNLLEE